MELGVNCGVCSSLGLFTYTCHFTNLLKILSFVQEDFLPFHCEGCKKQFCSQHREPSQHKCPSIPSSSSSSSSSSPLPSYPQVETLPPHRFSFWTTFLFYQSHFAHLTVLPIRRHCIVSECASPSLSLIECASCQQTVCIPHRHGADHRCPAHSAEEQRLKEVRAHNACAE